MDHRPILPTVVEHLRQSWKSLMIADLLFKAIAFVLLTPIVSLLFRGFLWLSGRSILADTDIAAFLIHPTGWLAGVVIGAAVIGILVLEQAVLQALLLSSIHGNRIPVIASLKFVAASIGGVFRITARATAKLLLLAVPFVVCGGGIFWFLLTDHDINYYLTAQPPIFWVAVISIGGILLTLGFLIIRKLVHWLAAVPIHLFEDIPAADCLSESRTRLKDQQKRIIGWLLVWAIVISTFWLMTTVPVIWLAKIVVPTMTGTVWRLVLALGTFLLLWGILEFARSLLAVISFSVIGAEIYDRFARGETFQIPSGREQPDRWPVKLTFQRIVGLLGISVIVAGVVGLAAVRTVRMEDDVEITAHRGGATKAPENTLAAIRQAIADGSDWIEIDVQESKDGVVVVAHDSDLMKAAGNPVKIWEATAEELRSIDIGSNFSKEFKDERVPTLTKVLLACKGKAGVNIELKYYGHTQNLERKVVDIVEQHGMASEIVVMSLKGKGIAKVKKMRPDWTIGLLTAVAVGDLTKADADFLAVNEKLATPAFIQQAHARGKDVFAWTINDAVTMSTMISRGVDNIITDDPELARVVLNERATLSPVERILIDFALRFGLISRDTD